MANVLKQSQKRRLSTSVPGQGTILFQSAIGYKTKKNALRRKAERESFIVFSKLLQDLAIGIELTTIANNDELAIDEELAILLSSNNSDALDATWQFDITLDELH